jgi:hypothetical protein
MNKILLGHLMKWVIISPFLLLALTCHVLTQYLGCSTIHQCLTTGTYKRGSGFALVGPVFLVLAFAFTREWMVLYLAGALLALEVLLGIATTMVIRKTNATPRSS